jgi:hypothetical protein
MCVLVIVNDEDERASGQQMLREYDAPVQALPLEE